MSYNAFLIVTSQMASKKEARFEIDGHLIFIEAFSEKNRWKLLTKVFHSDGYLPPSVQDYLIGGENLRWQNCGAYLKRDPLTQSIYLTQEIEMPSGKYIPFRQHINAFTTSAEEWRKTFENLGENDTVYAH